MIYACIVCGDPKQCGHKSHHLITKDRAAEIACAYIIAELEGKRDGATDGLCLSLESDGPKGSTVQNINSRQDEQLPNRVSGRAPSNHEQKCAEESECVATVGHVVGEGGPCWCGVTHALSTEFRLYYVCQHLANGKRCKNEIQRGEVFCNEHRAEPPAAI